MPSTMKSLSFPYFSQWRMLPLTPQNWPKPPLFPYAEQNDLACEYEYTLAFAKRQRLLSPEQYEIAGVLTSRGVSRVMLFSKAIIQAE
jgi:hypothetical protein